MSFPFKKKQAFDGFFYSIFLLTIIQLYNFKISP